MSERMRTEGTAAKWAQPKAGTALLPFLHSLTFFQLKFYTPKLKANSRLLSRMGSGNDSKLPHEPLHSSNQEIIASNEDRCLITTS